mgnify:CR=1 FL=1
MLRSRICLGLGAAVLLLGCGDAASTADTTSMPIDPTQLPGGTCTSASYHAEQGQKLQGSRGSSFTVQGVSLGCGTLQSLHVEGAELVGVDRRGTVRGTALIGGTVALADAQGQPATARIANVERDAADPTGATYLYTLVYIDPNTGAEVSACLPDPSGAAKALPLSGRWDASGAHVEAGVSISLGCTSGVLAKCVRWGYRPWDTVKGTSLADYHQACTRMARADYCGDGHTYTQEGTTVDIYDRLPVLSRDPTLLSLFESTWTPDGAYCVARERWLALLNLLPIACSSQFVLSLEASPVSGVDLCLERRSGATPAQALISNSTGLNIKL